MKKRSNGQKEKSIRYCKGNNKLNKKNKYKKYKDNGCYMDIPYLKNWGTYED